MIGRYWVGLGANLGDRRANIEAALLWLDRAAIVEKVSYPFETAPRERRDQPVFLNAAAKIASPLAPPAFLRQAKRLERELGRDPDGIRFGPRVIDCDVLLWDGGEWDDDSLQVPHPRLTERLFAMLPLLDIDPAIALPDGRPLSGFVAAIDAAEQPAQRLPVRFALPREPLGGEI